MKRGIFIITLLVFILTLIGLTNAGEGELHCTVRNVPDVTDASIQISNYSDAGARIRSILIYNMEGAPPICDGPWDYLREEIPPNGGTWFSVNSLINNKWCPPGIENEYWLLMKIIFDTKGELPLYGRVTEIPKDKKDTLGRSTISCEIAEYIP